jgi:hypothetical protein
MKNKMDISERQKSLINFIRAFMLDHAGKAPTLKDMLENYVAKDTGIGRFTSKSVLRYNIDKLVKAGLLEHLADGTARNIAIPGAVFTIPWNILLGLPLSTYELVAYDIDDYGIYPPEHATGWMNERSYGRVFTCSTKHLYCSLTECGGIKHIYFERPWQVAAELASMDWPSERIAIISNQVGMRLAAVGFGMGVFSQRDLHDQG